MKITSLIIVAVIGYIGFQQYLSLGVEEDTEIPIVEVYENDPQKKDKVEELITKQIRSNTEIQTNTI